MSRFGEFGDFYIGEYQELRENRVTCLQFCEIVEIWFFEALFMPYLSELVNDTN